MALIKDEYGRLTTAKKKTPTVGIAPENRLPGVTPKVTVGGEIREAVKPSPATTAKTTPSTPGAAQQTSYPPPTGAAASVGGEIKEAVKAPVSTSTAPVVSAEGAAARRAAEKARAAKAGGLAAGPTLPGVTPKVTAAPTATTAPTVSTGTPFRAATTAPPAATTATGANWGQYASGAPAPKPGASTMNVAQAIAQQYGLREGAGVKIDPATGAVTFANGITLPANATWEEISYAASAGYGQNWNAQTGQAEIYGPGGQTTAVTPQTQAPGIMAQLKGQAPAAIGAGGAGQTGGLPGVTPSITAPASPTAKEDNIPDWLKNMMPGAYQAGDIEEQVGSWAAAREQTLNQQIAAEQQQMQKDIQAATEADIALNPYGGAPGGAAWQKAQDIKKRYEDNWANMRQAHTAAVGQYRADLTEQQRQEGQQYSLSRFQAGLGLGQYELGSRAQEWNEIAQAKQLGQEDKKIALAERSQGFSEWATKQGLNMQWQQLSLTQKSQAVDQFLATAQTFGQAGANQFGIAPGTQTQAGWQSQRVYGPGGLEEQGLQIQRAQGGTGGITPYQQKQLEIAKQGSEDDRRAAVMQVLVTDPAWLGASPAERQQMFEDTYNIFYPAASSQSSLTDKGWLKPSTATKATTGSLPGVTRRIGGSLQ